MRTAVAIFAQALKIDKLLRVEELQSITAGFQDFSLEFKRTFYAILILIINLGDIAGILFLKFFCPGIPRQ